MENHEFQGSTQKLQNYHNSNIFMQIFLNLALFVTNANHLRTLLEHTPPENILNYKNLNFYFISVVLIVQCMLIWTTIFSCCLRIDKAHHMKIIKILSGFGAFFSFYILLINLTTVVVEFTNTGPHSIL